MRDSPDSSVRLSSMGTRDIGYHRIAEVGRDLWRLPGMTP